MASIINDTRSNRTTIQLRGAGDQADYRMGGNDYIVVAIEPSPGSSVLTTVIGSSVELRVDATAALFWTELPSISFTLDTGAATIFIDPKNRN